MIIPMLTTQRNAALIATSVAGTSESCESLTMMAAKAVMFRPSLDSTEGYVKYFGAVDT